LGLAGVSLSDKSKDDKEGDMGVTKEEDTKTSSCPSHCSPPMCGSQRCWCYQCAGWCPIPFTNKDD